jgi:acetate kinase
MKILVVNSGSSSIKYQLFDMEEGERLLAKGIADRIGLEDSYIRRQSPEGTQEQQQIALPDHHAALQALCAALHNQGPAKTAASIGGVGHRVVHGGETFDRSVLIDEDVLAALRRLAELAPLHNPPNIMGIEVCREMMPEVPNVAVFDTALHQTMPPKAYLYGLPMQLYKEHGIRKYGFHGTSHAYVAKEAARQLGRPLEELRVITCHLGNGCSITAFREGKSVDTSMGFTPLEGLVMGTRSGDLDPAVPVYLVKDLGMDAEEVDRLLNEESGLKGLCGERDMRDILDQARQGSEAAGTAVEVFVYRIQKYIGAYTAALGGVDVIVFTAGIGQNSPYLRERVLRPFGYLGLKVDGVRNEENRPVFSRPDSAVQVMAIPTNEELVIARDTYALVTPSQARRAAPSSPAEHS